MLDQPVAGFVREFDRDIPIRQLGLSCITNLSATFWMTSAGRWLKEITASRRLRNSGANSLLIASVSSPSLGTGEAHSWAGHVGSAGVRGHDDDDVPKSTCLPL